MLLPGGEGWSVPDCFLCCPATARCRDYRDRSRGGRDDGGYRKRERDDYREGGGRSGGDDYRSSRGGGGYDSYDRDSKRPRERDI